MEIIKKIDWYADWSGPFCLLEVSTSPNIYFSGLQKYFGKSLSHYLAIYREGVASVYLPYDEFQALGGYLASKANDIEYVKKWGENFKLAADEIVGKINTTPEEFLRKLRSLDESYKAYGAYNVATKVVFNYLPREAQEVKAILEDARIYSESFYKDNSNIFSGAADFLSKQTGYDKDLILMMSRKELYKYQESGQLPTKDELKQRYICCGAYFDKEGTHFLSKEEVEDIEGGWLKRVASEGFSGTVAYVGKVSGVCRIVLDYKKSDLKEGEILVTGMTDPHFVPLMKKAAGIITDGGGLLSHAAIIARELNKPCIVGTKIATKVLKNGDIIEVDAERGIVKKIR